MITNTLAVRGSPRTTASPVNVIKTMQTAAMSLMILVACEDLALPLAELAGSTAVGDAAFDTDLAEVPPAG